MIAGVQLGALQQLGALLAAMHMPVYDDTYVKRPHIEGVAILCHIGARLMMKTNGGSAGLMKAKCLQV